MVYDEEEIKCQDVVLNFGMSVQVFSEQVGNKTQMRSYLT